MRDDLQAAIDSACSSHSNKRPTSFQTLKGQLLEILRNLDDDLSVRDLREELEEG